MRVLTQPRQLLTQSLITLSLCAAADAAQAGTLTAELNRTEGSLGEAFLLSLSLEGDRDGDLDFPSVDGLVARQQDVSQSMVFNNGHRVSELHVTFGIYPQRVGTFTIPSISMTLDGKKEATLPLTLKVLPAGQAPQAQAGGAGGGGGGGGKAAAKTAEDTGGVFIERECDTTEPYVGQQVVCAVRVFHRGNLNGGQRVSQSNPDLRRFNVEGEKRYQRNVNGQRYGVIELREILVATKAGTLDVPPFTLDARILVRSRRGTPLDKFFDNFGGGVFNFDAFTEEKEVTIKSEPTQLKVKAPPEAGKPADFSGLVGQFQMSAGASRSQLPAGETVTITITVSGHGILDSMTPLKLEGLDKLGKIYADKPAYTEAVDGDKGLSSTQVFKYALVPSKEGTYPLGSLRLPFFDPAKQAYETVTANLGQLIVEPGKAEAAPPVLAATAPADNQQSVKELNKDLIGPHNVDLLQSEQTITRRSGFLFFSVGGLPLLFSLGLLTWERRRLDSGGLQYRRSRALRQFRDALTKTAGELGTGHSVDALTSTHRAFRSYLGDKLGVHGAALTGKEIDDKLCAAQVDQTMRQRVAGVLTKFEQVEFAGAKPGLDDARQLITQLESLVQEMDGLC